MTLAEFLAEWLIRPSILIAGGALLPWVSRVKDGSIRTVAWAAILCGSLAIPVLRGAFPETLVPAPGRTAAGVLAPERSHIQRHEYLRNQLVDATGIEGAYDLTLRFTAGTAPVVILDQIERKKTEN